MQDNNKSKLVRHLSSFGLTLPPCTTFFIAWFSLLISFHTYAENFTGFSLESNIKQCVALRQGQICYKKIILQWQATNNDNYCIVELGSNKIIQCWQQQNQGSTGIEFESDKDTSYALRRQNQTENLASTEIKISWVYEPKPPKSSGWRLF